MRMRDQLVVVIAVAVATIAVAANVLAQTRAADRRSEMEQVGLAVAWSYPVMDTTTSTRPADEVDAPAVQSSEGDSDNPRRLPPTLDSSFEPCLADSTCTIDDVLEQEFRNHGQTVRAFVRSLGFEEGLDGPRGSYVRQIARPDIEIDGPPRSDQAAANQNRKDTDPPPGQDKKDTDPPPGQDKKVDKDRGN